MAAPLIGVTGRALLAATAFPDDATGLGSTRMDLHVADFAARLTAAGGVPVQIALASDPEAVLDHLDGLLLSGGSDVDPHAYGAPRTGRPIDPERDRHEQALLAGAQRRGLPVLGACRGLQLVNVAHGGTLVADLDATERPGHYDATRPFATLAHPIDCAPGTTTATLYRDGTVVNSVHHQAIDRLGDGLTATAWAPDGVIEAIEATDAPLLAVQWHPEWHHHALDPAFGWLVTAAQARRAAVGGAEPVERS